MEKVEKKENIIQPKAKDSNNGEVSQLVSSTPLMLKKSNENEMAFNDGGLKKALQMKKEKTDYPSHPMYPIKRKNSFPKVSKLYARTPEEFFKMQQERKSKEKLKRRKSKLKKRKKELKKGILTINENEKSKDPSLTGRYEYDDSITVFLPGMLTTLTVKGQIDLKTKGYKSSIVYSQKDKKASIQDAAKTFGGIFGAMKTELRSDGTFPVGIVMGFKMGNLTVSTEAVPPSITISYGINPKNLLSKDSLVSASGTLEVSIKMVSMPQFQPQTRPIDIPEPPGILSRVLTAGGLVALTAWRAKKLTPAGLVFSAATSIIY